MGRIADARIRSSASTVGAFQRHTCTVPVRRVVSARCMPSTCTSICNSGRATPVQGSRSDLRLTRGLSATLPPHQRSLSYSVLLSFAVTFLCCCCGRTVVFPSSLSETANSPDHFGHATSYLKLPIESGAAPWTTPRRRQRRDGPASKRRPSSSIHPRRSTACLTKSSNSEHLPPLDCRWAWAWRVEPDYSFVNGDGSGSGRAKEQL